MTTYAQTLSRITGDPVVEDADDATDLVLELRAGRAATWGEGASAVLAVSRVVTSEEILAWVAGDASTFTELAPSPGPGQAFFVVAVFTQALLGDTPYTIPGGNASRIQFGPAAAVAQDYYTWETEIAGSANVRLADVLNGHDTPGDGYTVTWQINGASSTPASLMEDQPLVVGVIGDPLVGGDGDLRVTVLYSKATLS